MNLSFNENRDSNIIRIQKNLIMMNFDIEMVNKVLLYFNINSEDQAIDYLSKNSEGLWMHPFIEKIDEEPKNIEESKEDNNNSSIIKGMTSKIKDLKNRGFSNIIYNSLTNESQTNSIDSEPGLICEICGEPKSLHIKDNTLDEDVKEDLIQISENNEENNNIDNNNINNNLIQDHNINNQIDNNSMNINNNDECPICLDKINEPVELESCHHKFCYECFNEYLLDLIEKKNIEKIPCPNKNCSNKELNEEFFSQYLTEEQYFKFRQVRSQIEISKDPKKIFCPHCDSYASVPDYEKHQLDPNDPNYIKSTITCINGHNFCSCGIALHDGECYKDSNDFQKFLIDERVKQCPKCGFYIKKLHGCNHMTCGNPLCKYEFCWLCMEEAVPGHFQYGRCKGMQFVNPNSCFYKFRIRFPCIYCIYNLLMILIIVSVLILIPSLIFIFIAVIILAFSDEIHIFNNKLINIFYILTVCFALFALNNIGHCFILILILILLLRLSCKLLFCCFQQLSKFKSILINN